MEKKLLAGALGVDAFEKSANESAAPDNAIDLSSFLRFIDNAYKSISSNPKNNQLQHQIKKYSRLSCNEYRP
jgi:hypothetical protein